MGAVAGCPNFAQRHCRRTQQILVQQADFASRIARRAYSKESVTLPCTSFVLVDPRYGLICPKIPPEPPPLHVATIGRGINTACATFCMSSISTYRSPPSPYGKSVKDTVSRIQARTGSLKIEETDGVLASDRRFI